MHEEGFWSITKAEGEVLAYDQEIRWSSNSKYEYKIKGEKVEEE